MNHSLCGPASTRRRRRGYTLIELIVAVGLFALIMTLASGAYLVMIGVNRNTQAVSTGINNLAFALESMTRTIRTGTSYHCESSSGGNCSSGGTSFFVTDQTGVLVSYSRSVSDSVCHSGGNGCLVVTRNGTTIALTSPALNVSSLVFYGTGVFTGDGAQARVTIVVSGTVLEGPGKTQPFTVETGATMRGTDL